MRADTIAEIGIDEDERLFVRPATASFPYIYREAMEVHWDAEHRYLHSPKPREWTYPRWFQQIIAAAAEQGWKLQVTSSTTWSNISSDLRGEIMPSSHPTNPSEDCAKA